jgi:putative spermidine/putrescine transport system substrate-binding protein
MLHGKHSATTGCRKQVNRNHDPQGPPRPHRLRMAALAALAAVAMCVCRPAAARDLAVALHDLLAPGVLREAVIRPFADTSGLVVDVQRWEGGVAALRARLETRPDLVPPWDVLSLSGAELLAACDAGLLEKLDWAALGGRDRMLPGGAGDCGLGIALRALVIAWDRDKLPSAPGATPGLAEFGDVVKLPGRRGLRKRPRGTLEVALMADGVPPAEVYRQLRTEAGVDRAFRKLEQLRPYIVWWQDEVEAARLLASGEVLMTTAPSNGIAEAIRQDGRGFVVQWSGAVTSVVSLAIARGAAEQQAAVRLLAFAADARAQATLAQAALLGPLTRGALDALPPDLQALLPSNPAALAAGLPSDEAFWRDNLAKLTQRFDAWLPR